MPNVNSIRVRENGKWKKAVLFGILWVLWIEKAQTYSIIVIEILFD